MPGQTGFGIFRCFVGETPVATGWTEIGTASVGPLNEAAEEGLAVGWALAGALTVVAIGSQKKTRKKNKLNRTLSARKPSNIDEYNPNRYDPTPEPTNKTSPTMTTEQEQAFAEFVDYREDESLTLSCVNEINDVAELAPQRKPWLQKLLLTVPLLFACFCFWRALPDRVTSPQTAQAVSATSEPSRQLLTRRIDEIQPGHRVLAENPIASETHRDASEPNSIDDRLINFRMPKADSSFVDIALIRPVDWMESLGVRQGATITLDYPEFGAVGPAEVMAILPCPEIEAGTGEVVTGTFKHSSGDILDIQIESEPKPIGTTGNHPWWSEERQKFVEASELKPGETLRTADGKLTQIISITPRANAEIVYNLEVNREHVYYVGERGLLVHNSYPAGSPLQNAINKGMRSFRGKDAPDRMVEVMKKMGRPMSRTEIGNKIHKAKKNLDIGPAEDVVFDHSGGLWDSRTGEYISKIWELF